MYGPHLQSVALAVPEIIVIAVLAWGCESPILGKGGRNWSWMHGTVRKSVGDFLWALHCNFSLIFTRFGDISGFVLQHATFSHPTSSLRQISPCSPAKLLV